jgi:acetate kinase
VNSWDTRAVPPALAEQVAPHGPAAERSVLVVNRGSSSIKFGLFTLAAHPVALCRGTVDVADASSALHRLQERVSADVMARPLAAVVHRIVHGGATLVHPRVADAGVMQMLARLVHLAPNHLPDEIELIDAVRRERPDLAQIVCFDTAFHADLPAVARRLPVAPEYQQRGIRRYGFHGLSCTFLIEELRRRAPSAAIEKVILAHLGSGSSLTAVLGGRSIDTTMGLTPIGGVVMSTRAGDLDPGVVTHMARLGKLDADALEDELSHRSGLAAISGGISDMRELLRCAADEQCRLAVDIYCYQIRKTIGAYSAALEGLDALVFSGGIGEHAAPVRARICRGLEFLGLNLDEAANDAGAPIISTPRSRVTAHVIPTDEEVVMARSAYPLLT